MKKTTAVETRSPKQKSRGRQANGEPNLVDIHIGNRIRLQRQIMKLSQEQVAKMLGLTFQQVQKYEKGINRISGSRLWDFACIFGVDVNFFFTDMDQTTSQQSPRCISNKQNAAGQNLPNNPLWSDRSLEIIKAFGEIRVPQVAENMYNLLINLSLSNYMINKEI